MTPPFPWVLVKSLDAEGGRAEIDGVVYLADDERPVGGPMAALLGPRFPLEAIKCTDWYAEFGEEERRAAPLVRAYPVTALLGARVSCARDGELGERLAALLEEHCPGLGLQASSERHAGRLRKCGLVHTSLEAPPDETTDQPMTLELYGPVVELNGRPIGSGVGGWYDAWRRRHDDDYQQVEVAEPFVFELRAATYANVSGPGIDVPFYM